MFCWNKLFEKKQQQTNLLKMYEEWAVSEIYVLEQTSLDWIG